MSQTQRGHSIKVILCATRFTPTCDAAVDVAAGLARHLNARLVLMHVAERRSAGEEARKRLRAIVAARAADLPVEMVVGYGDPAHDVVRAARHEGADLIVVGRARSSGALVPLGIDEVLAQMAPCPVLPVAIGETTIQALQSLPGAPAPERRCLVCARAGDDLTCEPCRNRIVAEAIEHKRRVERAAGAR
jgi:nucleotide-binding universal stress UspA family protein